VARSVWREGKAVRSYLSLLFVRKTLTGRLVFSLVTRFLPCNGSMEDAVSSGLQSKQNVLCFSLSPSKTLSRPCAR
jgi:hypothetical protein